MSRNEESSDPQGSDESRLDGHSAETPLAESPSDLTAKDQGAFSRYSDSELERLLLDIRRLDEDNFISASHSAAVKD